jgi:TatD DNase family protein
MIDTHAHIFLEDFSDDIQRIINRAQECGIKHILMPGIDTSSVDKMDALITRFSGQTQFPRLHPMVGIHPCDVSTLAEKDHLWLDRLYNMLLEVGSRKDIVAIGETGLDYYWSTDGVDVQKSSLEQHILAAKTLGKPIVLHNRESTTDLLEIIEAHQDGDLRGVWHCFNGSLEEGKRAIELGLHLGIGGVITFKNAGVAEVVAKLPLRSLILETDSPYLTPTPFRGKRNEPSYLSYVVEKLSLVKGVSTEELVNQTSGNARVLFGL